MQVGVVGAGAMGGGIARAAAAAGHRVRLLDVRAGAARAAVDRTAASLEKNVSRGRLSREQADQTLARLSVVESVADLGDCDLVVEAVVEDLRTKQRLFAELEESVGPDCLLATNTSSLSVGAVFRESARAGRSLGLHFFNPAHVMPLVEVVPGPGTTEGTVRAGLEFVASLDKRGVVARDVPGFIVNLAGRAYPTEALAVVQEGVATPEQVDRVMREGHGFPLGPFELMDLTGLDVNYPVTQNIFDHNFADDRLRSTWQHRYLYEAGLLGQKAGQGFFRYPREEAAAGEPGTPAPGRPVPVALGEGEEQTLREFCSAHDLAVVADDGAVPVLVAPLGEDCTAVAARTGLDPRRVLGVDLAFGQRPVTTLMAPPAARPELVERVRAAVAARAEADPVVVNDSPGFVAQRILATVVNLGAEMAQRGVAAPADIDTAVELGLRYPLGPLATAQHHGQQRFVQILTGMHASTNDPRYRVSPWLRRRASSGLAAHHPDLTSNHP